MSFYINAWLDDGEPCLEVTDAISGEVRLHWVHSPLTKDEPVCSGEHPCPHRAGLERLFQELFVLSCVDKLRRPGANPRKALVDVCLRCPGCGQGATSAENTGKVIDLRVWRARRGR